ncbi:DNA-processing protein DprA [Actinoplanes flavus]|uniref:DNA-processing protein DprA n=1 Tax=Actinoplanes flavus TaxID=2820290 RepID=A0ABS3UD14_9ACTN|nr:DNA-processing protein DprA [Actinoplanes flavus]MBO3736671.1 DNA-processing protein DprA [Actinoplanes flavus]
MSTDNDRTIRAGLSYYTGRALPDHLADAVRAQGLQPGSWVFPKPADGLPIGEQQALDKLRALGRSLRDRARAAGATLIVPDDPGWPAGTGCNLPALWIQGNPDLASLLDQSVTLTGARACSEYGLRVAEEFTLGLTEARRTIVTSTAPGIARRALSTALSVPAGRTVLVGDQGLDQPFRPPVADAVARAASRGTVISPFPPGSSPTPSRRIFADQLLFRLAAGTVVVEASLGSQIMLAARHAAHAGFYVCAVPGPVTSALAAGCHQLVVEGSAEMVTNIDDVINAVGFDRPAFIKPFTVTVELRSGGAALGRRRHGPFMVWAASVAHAANTAFDLVVDAPSVPVDLTVWVHDASGGREAIAINRRS